MMIGKTENTSASYIAPTADAMRASAERAAQTKQDAQKNAAEELLETNAVYQLDISEEGWARMDAEQRRIETQRIMQNMVVNDEENGKLIIKDMEKFRQLYPNENGQGMLFISEDKWVPLENPMESCYTRDLSEATGQENAALISNMISIEVELASAFRYAQDKNEKWSYADSIRSLARALNAYSHKQREAIASGEDTYLTGIRERLNQVGDKNNPILWQMMSLVDSAICGQDIEVRETWDKAVAAWKKYHAYDGESLLNTKNGRQSNEMFNEKIAVYSYMQELARRQAEQEESLLDDMLGDGDEEKKSHAAGEVVKDSLEDGLAEVEDYLRRGRLSSHVYGEKLTPEEEAKEQQKIKPHVTGFDWQAISEKYLQANPDMRAVLADLSLPV